MSYLKVFVRVMILGDHRFQYVFAWYTVVVVSIEQSESSFEAIHVH